MYVCVLGNSCLSFLLFPYVEIHETGFIGVEWYGRFPVERSNIA